MRSKSLGAFRDTLQWKAEAYNGLRSGVLQALVIRCFDLGIYFNIGTDDGRNPITPDYRTFISNMIKWQRGQSVEHCLEPAGKRRWYGKPDFRINRQRELCAVRILRARFNMKVNDGEHEHATGDKSKR